jgi:hypothetical protein
VFVVEKGGFRVGVPSTQDCSDLLRGQASRLGILGGQGCSIRIHVNVVWQRIDEDGNVDCTFGALFVRSVRLVVLVLKSLMCCR